MSPPGTKNHDRQSMCACRRVSIALGMDAGSCDGARGAHCDNSGGEAIRDKLGMLTFCLMKNQACRLVSVKAPLWIPHRHTININAVINRGGCTGPTQGK